MSWFQRFLLPDEPVLLHARVHPVVCGVSPLWALGFFGFLYAAIAAPRALPGVLEPAGLRLMYVAAFFWILTILHTGLVIIFIGPTEFAVTDRRVIGRNGSFGLRPVQLRLDELVGVSVEQGRVGRLLDLGTVIIAGPNGRMERFLTIRGPMSVGARINQILQDHGTAPS